MSPTCAYTNLQKLDRSAAAALTVAAAAATTSICTAAAACWLQCRSGEELLEELLLDRQYGSFIVCHADRHVVCKVRVVPFAPVAAGTS